MHIGSLFDILSFTMGKNVFVNSLDISTVITTESIWTVRSRMVSVQGYRRKSSPILKTFSLPTDAHNVKKHRVIKTF